MICIIFRTFAGYLPPSRAISHKVVLHIYPVYRISGAESTPVLIPSRRWYRKCFHIETFCSDQKSRAFHLNKNHISDPQRLARLMIAACLAYIWIIYLGCLAMKDEWYKIIHRTDRCDCSLFRLGLKLLSHFLNLDMEIPVSFTVLKFDDPFDKKSVR